MYIIQLYAKKEKRKKEGRREGRRKARKQASKIYSTGCRDMLHFVFQNAALVKARQGGVR